MLPATDGNMANSPDYHGSLVAFEGPEETTLTQLRLLPSSSKILIVPSHRHFIKRDTADFPFDPRSYILKVHEACNARTQVAHSFLRYGTPDNKRLAFMHGGTASARLDCIAAISAHTENGDSAEAERIFNELIRDGVGSLKSSGKDTKCPWSEQPSFLGETAGSNNDETLQDPVSRAMRAADALDRKTASLQTCNEIDLTIKARPRSTSVPALRSIDDFQWTTSFYAFEDPEGCQGQAIPRTKEKMIENWRASAALNSPHTTSVFPSCAGEVYSEPPFSPPGLHLASPQSTTFSSTPNTPTVIGEAQVIDVRWSHKRTSSLGHPGTFNYYNQDISLSTPVLPRLEDTSNQYTNTSHGMDPPYSSQEEKHALRSRFFSEISRPAFTKSNRTTTRRSPPSPLKLDSKTSRQPASYVDQSTSPGNTYLSRRIFTDRIPSCQDRRIGSDEVFLDLEDDVELRNDKPFQAVLPMVEDFVLHLKNDEDPHPRLEGIIKALREGSYPVSTSPLSGEFIEHNLKGPQSSKKPTSISTHDNISISHSKARKAVRPLSQPDPDEYDPFASHGDYLQLQPTNSHSGSKSISSRGRIVIGSSPPTPAQTPPPADKPSKKIFHKLNITDFKTAICVQSSIRSILNVYFPPQDIGYRQFNRPALPELGSLWDPVFREAHPGGSPRNASRNIDLILAVGAQPGVDREFLGTITTSLERLGARPNGTTRSARLDLRYLIANAMLQGSTTTTTPRRPLEQQTPDDNNNNNNPLSDPPQLLATLIVPHLETYAATHPSARLLLLEYPPSHLATVLALQRLLGASLLKVVGILDASSSSSSSSSPHPHPHPQLQQPPLMSLSPSSFARGAANFFFPLPSTAGPSEVAALIAAVWRVLIDISAFYLPPEESGGGGGGTATTATAAAAAMLGFRGAAPTGPKYVSSGASNTELDPISVSVPARRAAAVSVKSGHGRGRVLLARGNRKLLRVLGAENEPPPSYYNNIVDADGDDAGEEEEEEGDRGYGINNNNNNNNNNDDDDDDDSQLAADERRYMPLWNQQQQQRGVRKGNARKALKWLGLAN
ncbi:hypothetical protein F4809DRAFT_139978 [Biscogniauxia mediterranea]|nr:hypothetical protein F4809DRAFT_139978 [Biscogniauxia mediterranea]